MGRLESEIVEFERPARFASRDKGRGMTCGLDFRCDAGAGFDPASASALGSWVCRGWLILWPGRPVPNAITTQEYYLGVLAPDNPSPEHQLVSSGTEGGVQTTVRSVLGGTGRYRGARGEVVQDMIGTNTTILNVVGEPAPDFRFQFRFQ